MIKRVTEQLEGQGLGLELTDGGQDATWPTRATTRRSAPVRCVGPSSAWSRTRCPSGCSGRSSAPARSSSSTSSPIPRAGRAASSSFRAVEGFEPPPIGAGRGRPHRVADRHAGGPSTSPIRRAPGSSPAAARRRARSASRSERRSGAGSVRRRAPRPPLAAVVGRSARWRSVAGRRGCQVQVDGRQSTGRARRLAARSTVPSASTTRRWRRCGDLDQQLRGRRPARRRGGRSTARRADGRRLTWVRADQAVRRPRRGRRGAGRGRPVPTAPFRDVARRPRRGSPRPRTPVDRHGRPHRRARRRSATPSSPRRSAATRSADARRPASRRPRAGRSPRWSTSGVAVELPGGGRRRRGRPVGSGTPPADRRVHVERRATLAAAVGAAARRGSPCHRGVVGLAIRRASACARRRTRRSCARRRLRRPTPGSAPSRSRSDRRVTPPP